MNAWKWAVGLAIALSACAQTEPRKQHVTKLNVASFSSLIFSKTTAFRHDSIPNGIAAIGELGMENGFNVDATEDSGQFTAENLANYQVVIFLNTTGTVLEDVYKAAFQQYIEAGNGYVGIHS